ncbi:hypothetical protein KY312_01010 [Candidatus Woesearchaeota archaeon]|nr:hypothetical protein [Candidatus Woesearchaeota archaeon]
MKKTLILFLLLILLGCSQNKQTESDMQVIAMDVYMGDLDNCGEITLWSSINKTSAAAKIDGCGGVNAYAFEIINKTDDVYYHVKIRDEHGWVDEDMISFEPVCTSNENCSRKCHSGVCVECIDESDCGNLLCNEFNECVVCAVDEDCHKHYDRVYNRESAMYYDEVLINKTCINSTCIDCISNDNCPNTNIYPFKNYKLCLVQPNSSENTCVPCTADKHCPKHMYCSVNRCVERN